MRITFRSLQMEDMALLVRWQSQPHVARWWQEPADLESITARYAAVVRRTEPAEAFIIELDELPIGLIQRYRHRDHPAWDRAVGVPGAVGIDYYIGEPTHLGRGLGSTAIAAFATDTLQHYPDVDCVVAVPQQKNAASWRSLEEAGFVRVWSGILDSDDPSDEGPAFVYRLGRGKNG